MDGALFLLAMIGVAWLVIWSCFDHTKPGSTWWPFDFRSNDAAEEKQLPRRRRTAQQAAIDPPRPWRRSRG